MDIQKLIELNIEIEGLLRVLANRDNADAEQLLFSKYMEFKTIIESKQCEPAALTADENLIIEDDIANEPEQVIEPEPKAVEPETVVAEPELVQPEAELETNESAQQTVAQQYQSNGLTTADEIVASRPNEMRVDEMLTRREARDLRKAFTLNDKFRFRRELFANNDAQFADTLNLLSAMKNMDEAVEYMRDDLGWDMDSLEVKDFVNIISNHFD